MGSNPPFQGRILAQNLEGCFGVDMLSDKGTSSAKCAAAMENNCQDNYTKLFPLWMLLDQDIGADLLRPLLDGTMAAVNHYAKLSPGERAVCMRDGERPGPRRACIVRDAQTLSFAQIMSNSNFTYVPQVLFAHLFQRAGESHARLVLDLKFWLQS